MAKKDKFYLGKIYDLKKKTLTEDVLTYDPPDLTTHALVTGMTGSGKTGLCVGLLEEAALQGIPAILIDPKGDLTNLALQFPDLDPKDFEPWIDATNAHREDKTVEEVAEKTAALWKSGLKDWGMGHDEILSLKNSVQKTIFTPGSTTGYPVNILASFQAPEISWDENAEALREKISSTVTALLSLVGMHDIDPLRSREHILLSNILEHHWQEGTSMDLLQLIRETQSPPFDNLGAFALNEFFPKKDRKELAMLLNNVLASPSFQSWIEGQPLDIGAMLYTADGRPRHSIFYLAHLDDVERMFFITLLYSAIETWMRKQKGTGDLRALVYFDEIHGYLPPVANPPSKPILIRLLKMARAFGVGLVLTTQNPVDVDYKALSNAGTWMIGRLQTDQDKQRLLDGLESAAGGIKRSDFDKMISALGKRVFLYHNVHEKNPETFHTRWVMSYLAGPLTLSQVPDLNKLIGAKPSVKKPKAESGKKAQIRSTDPDGTSTDTTLPGSIQQYFQRKQDAGAGTLQPTLLAVADVSYSRQRPPLNFEHTISAIIHPVDEAGQNWEGFVVGDLDAGQISDRIPEKLKLAGLPAYMEKSAWWSAQEKDFEHWIYETDAAIVRSSKKLGISAGPEVDQSQFERMVKDAAQEKLEADLEKLEDRYASKQKTLEDRIERQELKIEKYRKDLSSRGLDTALKVGESLLKLATKKKLTGLSSTSSKARMAAEARSRLKEAQATLENYQEDLRLIQEEFEDKKHDLEDKWADAASEISEVKISPTKQNIRITHFGLLWQG